MRVTFRWLSHAVIDSVCKVGSVLAGKLAGDRRSPHYVTRNAAVAEMESSAGAALDFVTI